MTKDKFQREERYLVFKLSDVEEHFTPGEKQQLARLAEVQRVGRSELKKPPLDCVVVESDWPEYEPTWRAIEARVTGAQTQPTSSTPEGYKLMPIEPTEEMLRAMTDPFIAINGDNRTAFESAYKAMLAAAPNERSEYPEAKP